MAVAPLDKCTVAGPILSSDGKALYPALVRFTLSSRDRDGDITIMPAPVDVPTDVDGNISVGLWPNSDGYAGTFYKATVTTTSGKVTTSYPGFTVVVPNTDAAILAEIMDLVPNEPVGDARAAAIEAQGYASAAHSDASAVHDDRVMVEAAVASISPHYAEIATVAGIADDVQAVAGIASQIVTMASIATQIQMVATYASAVVTVAGSITGLDAIAANLPAVLDASNQAAAAAISAADALTYSLSASAYNDQANAHQLLAANYASNASASFSAMVTALANVTNYNNTLGQLTGAAKQIVAGTDVAAACIYDTALDSDPKWRTRARWQSWFWEQLGTATRGVRQFFPKRALIIGRLTSATACTFTVYDLDDSACPMWAVWNGIIGSAKNMVNLNAGTTGLSVDARNGFLYFGTTSGGLSVVDLIGDSGVNRYASVSYNYAGNVSQRNAGLFNVTTANSLPGIVSQTVASVATTVLPGTPVDPIRKLPAPTVAVATGSGVSVIHWDNRVANSSSASSATLLSFAPDGSVRWWINSAGSFAKATPAGYAVTGFVHIGVLGGGGVPRLLSGAGIAATPNSLGQTSGLQTFGDAAVATTNFNAAITSTFNTGRLYGSTVLALAESIANTNSLVASNQVDDMSAYADTAAMLAVWTGGGPVDGSRDLVASKMRLTTGPAGTAPNIGRSFPVTVGQAYRVTVSVTTGTSAAVRMGKTSGGTDYGQFSSFTGTVSTAIVATGPSLFLHAYGQNGSGNIVEFSSFGVQAVVQNRSSTATGATVVGTIARAAVAPGAELAYITPAVSGSGLEFDSSSLVAIGTGDFSFSMLVRAVVGGSTIPIVDVRNSSDTGYTLQITRVTTSGSGSIALIIPGGATASGTTSFSDSVFRHVVVGRRSGVLEVWINGVREGTAANAVSLASAASIIHLLKTYQNSSFANAIGIANLRFASTMPTPAQIRAMSAAELLMLQPGAKCLLTGTDSVQGLTYDDGTGLLRVHKPVNGTDVFSGLVRIATENMASENELSAELLTNTTFDTVVTPWDAAGAAVVAWAAGGGMSVTRSANSNDKARYALTGLTVGQTYQFLIDVTANNVAACQLVAATTNSPAVGTVANSPLYSGVGTGYSLQFVATAASMWIFAGPSANGTTIFKNPSFKRVITNRMTSNNHKNGFASNDNVAIYTDAECYVKTPSYGLREAVDAAIGRQAATPIYDRTYVLRTSAAVTTNATPTVIGYLPMDKGEAGTWIVRVTAREYGEPAAPELASYERRLTAARPQEGNIAISGSVVPTDTSETTSTMDVTIAANTTVQALAITATGVAAKNLEWGIEATFIPSVQQVAA